MFSRNKNEAFFQNSKRPKSQTDFGSDFIEETRKRRSLPGFQADEDSPPRIRSYSRSRWSGEIPKGRKRDTIDDYYENDLETTEKTKSIKNSKEFRRSVSVSPKTKKGFFETLKIKLGITSPNAEKLKKLDEDYKKRLKEHEETIRKISMRCEQREKSFLQELNYKNVAAIEIISENKETDALKINQSNC